RRRQKYSSNAAAAVATTPMTTSAMPCGSPIRAATCSGSAPPPPSSPSFTPCHTAHATPPAMEIPNTSSSASSASAAKARTAGFSGMAGNGGGGGGGGGRSTAAAAGTSTRRRSDVEVGDLQRVVLDELAPRLDDIAHQGAEDLVGGDRVLDPHLK